jgi:trans-aconitate methyltransferase
MLRGKLYTAPIISNPQPVLDFGTGTGIWALDFADEFPSAEVISTDLSPIQPDWVAPNCRFIIDDVEDTWAYPPDKGFDYIQGRGMAGSIKDWAKLYDQIYKHLKPGDHLKMQEYDTWIRSDDGGLDNAPNINEWQQKVDKASTMFGKRMNVASEQKAKIIAAGFEDVTEIVHKVLIRLYLIQKKGIAD